MINNQHLILFYFSNAKNQSDLLILTAHEYFVRTSLNILNWSNDVTYKFTSNLYVY